MLVTVYSTKYCGYCRMAEQLLILHAIPYEIVDVTGDRAAREALVSRAHGRRTVPVIVAGDWVIGGYTELASLAARGDLRARLGLPEDGTRASD
jgi:glutaredoxin 3